MPVRLGGKLKKYAEIHRNTLSNTPIKYPSKNTEPTRDLPEDDKVSLFLRFIIVQDLSILATPFLTR